MFHLIALIIATKAGIAVLFLIAALGARALKPLIPEGEIKRLLYRDHLSGPLGKAIS